MSSGLALSLAAEFTQPIALSAHRMDGSGRRACAFWQSCATWGFYEAQRRLWPRPIGQPSPRQDAQPSSAFRSFSWMETAIILATTNLKGMCNITLKRKCMTSMRTIHTYRVSQEMIHILNNHSSQWVKSKTKAMSMELTAVKCVYIFGGMLCIFVYTFIHV